MTAPPDQVVKLALQTAALSPCLSKRGVVAYIPDALGGARVIAGAGYNSPPAPFTCPGRAVCAGNCGKRCVHAEMRALRSAADIGDALELVHVELATAVQIDPDGPVTSRRVGDRIEYTLPARAVPIGAVAACDGPGCWQCELPTVAEANAAGVTRADDPRHAGLARWRRYTAEEFYRVTLQRCGMASP